MRELRQWSVANDMLLKLLNGYKTKETVITLSQTFIIQKHILNGLITFKLLGSSDHWKHKCVGCVCYQLLAKL